MSGITITVAMTKPVVTQVISSTVAPSEPAQVRHGHVDDRRVDGAHQRAEGDRDGDQPLVDRLARRNGRSDRGCHRAAPFRKKSTTAATASDAARGATPYFSRRSVARTAPSKATANDW